MASANTKVLIVEDEPVTRRGLQLFVQKLSDIDVVGTANDGEEALSLVQELHPDLVLMDIGLPGIDGINAAKLIKEILPDQRIVMLTADSSAESVFASFNAGADGYVLKSSFAYSLELAIRTVRCGSVWLDPHIARAILRMAFASPNTAGRLLKLSSREENVLSEVAYASCANGVCLVKPEFVAELRRFRPHRCS